MEKQQLPEPRYLGDSVYARSDREHIFLELNNGYGFYNTIAMDPEVLESLDKYREYTGRFFREQREQWEQQATAERTAGPGQDPQGPAGP